MYWIVSYNPIGTAGALLTAECCVHTARRVNEQQEEEGQEEEEEEEASRRILARCLTLYLIFQPQERKKWKGKTNDSLTHDLTT